MLLVIGIIVLILMLLVFAGPANVLGFLLLIAASAFVAVIAVFYNGFTYQSNKVNSRLKWERKNADVVIANRAAEEVQKAKQRADEALSFSDEDRLRPAFDPQDFEAQIAELFRMHGYRVIETPYQGDHGIDLKVYNKDEYSVVQCKRYSSSPVGEPAVRDFFGTMQHEGADMGYIVTTSRFTKSAIEWAKGKRIVLIDGEMLQKMLSEIGDSQMNRGVI